MCAQQNDDAILDVMPTDEEILTFGNYWYKQAVKHPMIHQVADDLIVKSVTAPYLLATKMDAFNSRGNKDYLGSHDLEDIINVISGRVEIIEEVHLENEELKHHIQNFLEKSMKNDDFLTALPGHLNEGPVTEKRLKIVTDRIKKIMGR